MNICVVRHGYYPEDPRVLKEVHALRDAGYSVDVICLRSNGEKSREIVDGVQVYRLSHQHIRGSLARYLFEYGLSFLKMFIMVTLLFFRRSYRCLQVNTLPDPLIFLTVVPRFFGAAVLLDMHEPTPELFVTKYGENKHALLLKMTIFLEQWSIKFANQVLTVNDLLRMRFIERGARGDKIHVVRNVPNEGFCTELSGMSPTNGFTLVTHGTIAPRYGHEVLIRALSLIRDKIADLQLCIVGDTGNAKQLHSLATEQGCLDIVTFTGRVPLTEVGELINAADVGVVPLLYSPFSELCQPNKIFEYVACRKPVIASRLRAIEETFDDSCVMFSEPGNHEDLANRILELYEHPNKRIELVENAFARYEKMRWKDEKKSYLQVVESLVKT